MGVRIHANLNSLFFLFFFLPILNSAFARNHPRDCAPTICRSNGSDIIISYPFRTESQPPSCSLEGFNVSCRQNQTYVHIPSSGDFNVIDIDYGGRFLTLSDPNKCLHKRLLKLNLTSSPFSMPQDSIRNATYVKCDKNITETSYGIAYIPCLSDSMTWYFVLSADRYGTAIPPNDTCWMQYTIPLSTESYQFIPMFNKTFHNTMSGNESYLILTWDSLPSTKKGSSTKDIVIGLCVGGSIFTAATLMLAFYIHFKPMKQGNREDQLKVENLLKECRTFKLRRYSYANIKLMTEKFKFKLGKGGYGTVYRGKLSNGMPVAVKILENSKGNGKDFINEIATIGRIYHVNVVRLLGFCLEKTKRALIYEFLPNESLEKYIFDRDTSTYQHLGWKKLLDIAIGMARGIEYLHHGCDHHILHLDIKPHNILLDKDFNPKISDFGLAKICSSNQRNVTRMMSTKGTMGYIAPELFSRTFGVVSYKSDVYSFGMVMLEMVGGRMTRYETTDPSSEDFFPHWIYDHLGSATETEGDEITRKLTIVALWCIQWNPNDRPPMKRVIKMLEGKTESLGMPQNPFVSSESLST